jgi:hypothetical protein
MADSGRKPFAAFVQEQRGGGLHGELSDRLAEVVQAVLAVEKPGKLTLIVKVVPSKDGATVIITDEIKTILPEAPRGAGIFFVDADGNLSRQNPNQMEMPLREINRETGEIREIDGREEVS